MSSVAHGDERPAAPPRDATASAARRAFAVTAPFDPARAAEELGSDAHAYADVYRAFRPLLQRLGTVIEVDRPESRLDFALRQARERGQAPTHLSFLPLSHVYLSSMAANVAVVGWGLTELPNADLGHDARQNWVRIAERLSLILCLSEHTRAAFVRAAVRTPARVVRVPMADELFALPLHAPEQLSRFDGTAYVMSGSRPAPAARDPWESPPAAFGSPWAWAGALYARLQPHVPEPARRVLRAAARAARAALDESRGVAAALPDPVSVDLSGVVYVSIVDPGDRRANWEDLLSAFLIALRNADDATLVLALVAPPRRAAPAVRELLDHYRGLGLDHRCRLVLAMLPADSARVLELGRHATYGLSAAHAEAAALPIQQLLAAARPVVAPVHTAFGDYLDDQVGFPVASHAEPTHWPADPSRRLTTTWHRIDWQSLHDQIQASYAVATTQRPHYERLARRARERMRELAAGQPAGMALRAALGIDDGSAAVR